MNRDEDEQETRERLMENLLGDIEKLIPFFETKTVTDVYVYGGGDVHVGEFGKKTYNSGIVLSYSQRMRIINSLASVADTPIDKWVRPTLESIIPKYNIRTTAILPSWTTTPEITFRRPPDKIFTLEEYVQEGRLSQALYDKIVSHIEKRSNIVISGSTGSGKTTMTNACIKKMLDFTPDERLYIVEDTPELQCLSPYKTQLYIRKDQAVAAIQTALRWTPKRIIFGELRSGEVAQELLEAWNTGHPGNITTIHADNAASTIPRIEGLLRQVIKGQLPDLADSIHLIVHLSNKTGLGPVVDEALTVREIQEAKK
jgi:type IV secretion system protein VirB11